MHKQIVTYPWDGILLSNEKDLSTNIHNDTDKAENDDAEKKSNI